MKFVNRKEELEHLKKEYAEKGAKFVVVYGRRRIGKTRLIEEFVKNKPAVYYLAAQEKDRLQIQEFKNIIYAQIKDEFLLKTIFEDWKHFFSYLEKIWPKKEKIVLAIDEVTFIIKENPSFTSYLQKFWDSFLSKTNTFLILSGSLVGLMLKEVLSYDSPLYGRRTSQIHLEEFSFKDSCSFMLHLGVEEQIKFFSITSGVPKYLLFINKKEPFNYFLLDNFFNKEGFFYREGLFLLSQEFKDPSTYINILKAISYGNTKLNEIANFTGLEAKKISSYLDILIHLNLIKKEVPVTEDPKKFRGALYLLNDNFLIFWHKFVHPNRSLIELRRGNEVLKNVGNEINSHIALKFEHVCKEFLYYFNIFQISKIGRWWGAYRENGERKSVEIDMVALNEKNKEILFAECKWKNKVNSMQVIKKLAEKADYVEWNKEKRKESFAVFAKSFSKRIKEFEGKKVYCFDLKDIEKVLKN